MSKIGIFYGSTTGTTEDVARKIAAKLGVEKSDLHDAAKISEELVNKYDVLVLGSATWGDGELQDDWYDGVKVLKGADLSGKTVALFGCGDSESYPDTFVGGMAEIYNAAKAAGADVIGAVSTDGYTFDDSESVVDGHFVGLALDEVNEDDKTEVGNPHPDITMGLSFNVGYKGFDLAVTTYGAFGQQNMRSYRKFTDGNVENYTSEVFEYWHGEGTSNRYPRLVPGNTGVNFQQISDIFVEDASYFRIQNVTLGYDFKNLWKNCPLPQLRLYVSAQNLFTFTGYKGMDPEIGYGSDFGWVQGIDLGYYPEARTCMLGLNVKF